VVDHCLEFRPGASTDQGAAIDEKCRGTRDPQRDPILQVFENSLAVPAGLQALEEGVLLETEFLRKTGIVPAGSWGLPLKQ